MFIHLLKYSLKRIGKNRNIVFWLLAFPVIIGTFMHLMTARSFEMEEKFDTIPVAVVVQADDEEYSRLLREAASGRGMPLLEITETTEQEAQALLEQGKAEGIVYIGDKLSLRVLESGDIPSLLQLILNRVEQCRNYDMPWTVEHSFVTESDIGGDNMKPAMNFIYAVMALVCLLASLAGYECAMMEWDGASGPGLRRAVSPVGRTKGMLADFLACEIAGYGASCIVFIYMRFVLGVRLGDRYLLILLLLLPVAVSNGIMLGMFTGSLPLRRDSVRLAVLTGIILVCCALDDLMIHGIRDGIEHSIPWLNDINPAAMISDAFYSLNVYGGYSRFLLDTGRLGGVTVLLVLLCLILKRRKRYAGV